MDHLDHYVSDRVLSPRADSIADDGGGKMAAAPAPTSTGGFTFNATDSRRVSFGGVPSSTGDFSIGGQRMSFGGAAPTPKGFTFGGKSATTSGTEANASGGNSNASIVNPSLLLKAMIKPSSSVSGAVSENSTLLSRTLYLVSPQLTNAFILHRQTLFAFKSPQQSWKKASINGTERPRSQRFKLHTPALLKETSVRSWI